jgi:hypothetical protein
MDDGYWRLVWVVEQVHAEVPLRDLRADLVAELILRGVLEVGQDGLGLSELGEQVFAKIAKGERAEELD